VEYSRAKVIGDSGEREVARTLQLLAPQYGFTIINNLLLAPRYGTAQIDHVIVDRFGVLIVECKVRRDALIKGRDTDAEWTACYRGQRNWHSFQNPLRQADTQKGALLDELERVKHPLSPDYVRTLAVFCGANISELKLDSIAQARVATVEQLAALFEQRHAFAINLGDLDPQEVERITEVLQGLNHVGDAAAEAAHHVHRSGRMGSSVAATPGPAPQRPHNPLPWPPPALPSHHRSQVPPRGRSYANPGGSGGWGLSALRAIRNYIGRLAVIIGVFVVTWVVLFSVGL